MLRSGSGSLHDRKRKVFFFFFFFPLRPSDRILEVEQEAPHSLSAPCLSFFPLQPSSPPALRLEIKLSTFFSLSTSPGKFHLGKHVLLLPDLRAVFCKEKGIGNGNGIISRLVTLCTKPNTWGAWSWTEMEAIYKDRKTISKAKYSFHFHGIKDF